MAKEMRPSNPITEKQVAFIKKLVAQGKTIDHAFKGFYRPLLDDKNLYYLSKYDAINVIDALLAS